MELILNIRSLRELWTRCQKLNSRCGALWHLFVLLRNSWVLSVKSQAYSPLTWAHSKKKKKKKTYTSERTGVRGSVARNAHRGNIVCLVNEVPLLRTQGQGCHCTHTAGPASMSWSVSHQNKNDPVCCSCCQSALPEALHTHLRCGHHTLPQLEKPQLASAFTPSYIGREQMSEVVVPWRWGQNQSWTPRVKPRKRRGNLPSQLHKPQIKSPGSAW